MSSLTLHEYLIQRFFSQELTDSELRQMTEEWDRDETFRALVRQHQDVEHRLNFFGRLERRPIAIVVDGKEYRPDFGQAGDAQPAMTTDSVDFDALMRLARAETATRPVVLVPTRAIWDRLGDPFQAFGQAVGRRGDRVRKIVAGVVLLLAVAVLALLVPEFRRVATPGQGRTVAHLSGFDAVVWGDCLAPILPGDPIETGWLRVASGSVSFKLLGGADIVLEGPAEFRIDSETRTFLRSGYLSAEVPPQSKKLKIKTPQLDVDVLGTAFWVKADADNSEVHLIRGKLELAGASFGKILLGAGEAFSLPKSGKSRRFEVIKEDFVPAKQVVAGTEATLQSWDADDTGPASPDATGADPSLLIHFDFERMGRTVPNMSPTGRRSVPSGRLSGCARTEGHDFKSRGIAFRRLTDQLAIDLPGRHDALTLSAWVKIAKPVESRIPLFMSAGMPPGAVQWMIGRGGMVQLNIVKTATTPNLAVRTAPLFVADRIGRWVHLTTVVDPTAKKVVFYVDGEEFESKPLDFAPVIEIGPALLGSWDADRNKNMRSGELHLDEFRLFNRALPPEEIKR